MAAAMARAGTSAPKVAAPVKKVSVHTVAKSPKPVAKVKVTPVHWGVIVKQEGIRLNGYVPVDKSGNAIGRSGVTIGMGFDIGQRNRKEILALAVPYALKVKFLPYAELRKEAAVAFLKTHQLTITKAENDSLTAAVRQQQVRKVTKIYNAHSVSEKDKFESLASGPKTVVVSLYHQNGDSIYSRFQNVMKHIHAGNYSAAAKALVETDPKYLNRRKAEAAELIKAKPAPAARVMQAEARERKPVFVLYIR